MVELENVLISCAFEGYNINFFCQMIKHTIMVDGVLVLLLPVRISFATSCSYSGRNQYLLLHL